MGTLYYGAPRLALKVGDHVLAHLKIVTTAKLRRGEGFLLSWNQSVENGSGRGSVWLHSQGDLVYMFDGNRAPKLEPELLDKMAMDTAGSTGLHIEATMDRSRL
jgi:hypothetical protein